MKYKKLLIICILGIAVAAYFFVKFFEVIDIDLEWTSLLQINIGFILVAMGVHVCGHMVRAYKSGLLLDPIKHARTPFLFKMLSIGFLFNVLLPFRIGELIRAHLMGKNLCISRTVVFLTILFERAVDGIILCVLSLAFIYVGTNNFNMTVHPLIYQLIIMVGLISVCTFIGIYLLKQQNNFIIKVIEKFSSLFNLKLRNKMRFIAWSGMYGMNVVLEQAKIFKYLVLSIVMWGFYIGAMMLTGYVVLGQYDLIKETLIAIATYLGVALPSGPGYLGSYHYFFSSIVSELIQNKETILSLSLITWVVSIAPITIFGTIFLIGHNRGHATLKSFFNPSLGEASETDTSLHKLYRHKDISDEFNHFLDAYFKGTEITHELNKCEMRDEIKLIKAFKGGSNAITALVWKDGQKCVRKITLVQFSDKLEAQHKWLQARSHLKHIPNIIGMTQGGASITLDIEYEEELTPFFEYIHSNSTEKSKEILQQVVNFVQKDVHGEVNIKTSHRDLEHYIEHKINQKIHDTVLMSHDLSKLIDYEEVVINGAPCMNIHQIIEKIIGDKEIMQALARHEITELHGDLTVDNILVKDGHFVILDPNNENYISDPLVDYGKLFQSLHSGYEFLCNLKEVQVSGNYIHFEENISSKYVELFEYLEEMLKSSLSKDRYKLIKFHEAVHYCRMLTYRARINPKTLVAFYAIAVRLFNEFYNDYRT